MPGPDQINEQKLRDIKNLSPEDLEEIYSQYGISNRQKYNTFDGLVVPNTNVDLHRGIGIAHQAQVFYEGAKNIPLYQRDTSDKITLLAKNMLGKVKFDYSPSKDPSEMTEKEYELHHDFVSSRYEAEWMYPYLLDNAKMAHIEMVLHGMDFSDQIDSEHEQYSYLFNIHRDNCGLPRIELSVGALYELRLGRRRDIVKRMILVEIKGGLESGTMPELYFENENTYYNHKGHRTNINHVKIWKEIKSE